MSLSTLKTGYYVIAALCTIATQYYFNYLFFFLHDRFGFGNRENLAIAAMHGAVYTVAAWQCGKFAERYGFHTSLKIGFTGLAACMAVGLVVDGAAAHVALLAVYTGMVLFIWPALEALTTEHEPPHRVPHMIGMYNCTWSGAAALAYFSGGALYDRLGAETALFLVPGGIFVALFVIAVVLQRQSKTIALDPSASAEVAHVADPHRAGLTVRPETFLTLAWIANPFSYVAIYTLLAVMPALAERFGFTPIEVGLFCSVWFFGRLGAFIVLWHWTGWHYRFRWLAGGYVLLIASFVGILMSPALWMVIVAQVAFGIACGLMYYSSLFYSLDVGEAKAEHGGLHEAAIGAGICAGPAVGALSLYAFPGHPQASAIAVTGLLLAGFAGLVGTWRRGATRRA